MMKTQQKYKITNITVKKPRLHPKSKADLRTALEKVGHPVSIRDDSGNPFPLFQNRSKIVSDLNEGTLALARGGFINITPVDDVVTALKDHTLQTKERTSPGVTPASGAGKREPDKEESDHGVSRRAKAKEMGQSPTKEQINAQPEADVVNPDGKPNFEVTAPSKETRSRRNRRKAQKEVSMEDLGTPKEVGPEAPPFMDDSSAVNTTDGSSTAADKGEGLI